LRQGYQQALRLADEGNWAQIADIPALRAAKVDKLKTLYLYHRDQILPAYSQEHLKHFASRLGLTVDEDIVLLNRRILAHLAGVPGLESANSLELSTLLYAWASPPGYDVPDYVKIAPGPRADKWSECLAGEYICVGWDEVGDLSLFETEEEFRVAFTESQATSNRSLTTRKARELWRLTQLAAGRQGGG
jgi:5-methylcytosine-specific restriction protein B